MSLSDNMLLIRKKMGLSQADLGKMIGTSSDVIARYERGDISPSVEVASKIAPWKCQLTTCSITKMEMNKQRLEDISNFPTRAKDLSSISSISFFGVLK